MPKILNRLFDEAITLKLFDSLGNIMISVKNITKTTVILRRSTAYLRCCRDVGFLGPNGAGKSTSMKMITGFLVPDAGDIVINGQSVLTETKSSGTNRVFAEGARPMAYDGIGAAFICDVRQLKGDLKTHHCRCRS